MSVIAEWARNAYVKWASGSGQSSDPFVGLSVALEAGSTVAATVTGGTVQEIPATSGGLSTLYTKAANSNNATSVKASAGQLYHLAAFNSGATAAYLKFYNKATAPTPSSDTVVHRVMIPAQSGVVENWPTGFPFSTGIACALVTDDSDTGNTSVAASTFTFTLGYK